MEATAFVEDADRFDVTVDEPDPELGLSEWPVNVVVRTSEQLMGHRLKLYLSFPAARSLVRQLARELHEAGHKSGVTLTGEDRKAELRSIADRLLGIAGADDDLVEEAESNARPFQGGAAADQVDPFIYRSTTGAGS